ncbi:hypothetical protein [Nocardioides alcanivorans]|uniref:hypothetical protein n=1 Tax=Nocardioides alcanivorans TaxID=2897352 RepID=UPI001F2653C7|nr:hypothetical protein [Nocardioides alcanivorans]
MTVRDLGRGVPAMWQENLKSGGSSHWADYLTSVEQNKGKPGRLFWRQQAAARIARNWARVFGPGHVTVVTVPAAGTPASVLWDRFRTATALDLPDVEPLPAANQSLGAASCLVLREANERVRASGADWELRGTIKRKLAKQVLARHRDRETPLGFVPPPWLHDRAATTRSRLEALDVAVVGDLAELEPRTVPGTDPSTVPIAEQHEAALWAIGELMTAALNTEAERIRST